MKSNTITSNSTPSPGELIWVGTLLCLALLISCLSGFHSVEVPFDLAWQFSPIGLLQGITPENASLESGSYFAGKLGWSPDYFLVFMKTCLLEFPFYALAFRKLSWPKILLVTATGNILTHPIVFFVLPAIFQRYLVAALVAEVFAAGFEALFAVWVMRALRFPNSVALQAAALVILANLFSWEVGSFL